MMSVEPVEIQVSSVVFRQDLYPRIETNPTVVQKYAEDLDILPPIEVNQRRELIDGWHRWTAHKKRGAETIRAIVTTTNSDAELLELAITRNATHGLQLSQADKRDMARRIYNSTPEGERDATKARLATVLSVSERTVREWLSRIDKDTKEARDRRIFDLWLACWTQEEIAREVGCEQKEASRCVEGFSQFGESAVLTKTHRAAADHATDFEVPIYNVWKQQEKSAGSNHFGNSEARWLDNLLYLYTQPFDVVVDPFAGGGSTIDVCKKRFRRYFVSDRLPIVERAHEIRQHDVTAGLLKPPQWKDVSLVYLDPPYWKQAEGRYSQDESDLANMSLEAFTSALGDVVTGYSKKLRPGARIAMLMQPTQWKAPDRIVADHIADLLRAIKMRVDMRFSAPYESQQCTAQMVEWAKAERRCLVLTREIVVWVVS